MKARVLVGLQFGLLGLLALVKGSSLVDPNSIFEKLSPYLYVIGALILILAYKALRPSLRVSPIPLEGAPLITTGIYKWLRHPMYFSVLIFGAGLALRGVSLVSIGLWLILFIVLIIKASYEDSLLALAHSQALDYQRNTRGIFLTKKIVKEK